MPEYVARVGSRSYRFESLGELLAKATPARSGDELAGVAAPDNETRLAARRALAEVPLKRFLEEPLIDPAIDDVSRLIFDQHRPEAFAAIEHLTVGEFRDWLLDYDTTGEVLQGVAWGITPEMAAAVSKLMRNQDLILAASKIRNVTAFRDTIGLPGRISVRLQPNHPTDHPQAIAATIAEGLLYGCGDAVIGINPATDDLSNTMRLLSLMESIITRFEIPTQSCVLAHVTTQMQAMKRGAPVDLVFQSIAGTQAANSSFGVTLGMLDEARVMAIELRRGTVGQNCMYFETGQGSCLSADAHHGLDQQTCEARAYAVARRYEPLLVNTVVGFIGPEYLFDGRQILRAGLEDHFCGKLLGLPMGCDICYTNHAEADPNDSDNLLGLLGMAGCNYVMGVPGTDDIMLGYQSTSFHDVHFLRQTLGLRPAPEFEDWLVRMGLTDSQGRLAEGRSERLTAICSELVSIAE
ncbi:ethanolamine ammonia-lyase subunit EutB [bacterium]|nr:ethanolamine ammonia-lyase subunit EutB [bacterium]